MHNAVSLVSLLVTIEVCSLQIYYVPFRLSSIMAVGLEHKRLVPYFRGEIDVHFLHIN